MSLITIGVLNYLDALELSEKAPAAFIGCRGRYIRRVVQKKKLQPDQFIFAALIDGVWTESTPEYKRAKLLISASWAAANISGIAANSPKPEDEKYREIPAKIALDESDMFRDCDGKLFEICMVGERKIGKCFFKVADVSKAFEMPNLDKTITNLDKGFRREEHFICFYDHHKVTTGFSKNNRLCLFLTFSGLMKVIFSSKIGCAEMYVEWCINILFKATFGSEEEKIEISAEIMKVPQKSLKAVLCKSATDFPVIYLYRLVKSKTEFFKFGCTADFRRRSDELARKFKLQGIEKFDLEIFCYIDPKYTFQAETSLKEALHAVGKKFDLEGFDDSEYVVLPGDKLKFIADQFRMIGATCSGQTTELVELESRIATNAEKYRHEKELLEEKHRSELLMKQVEILELKLKLAAD